MDAISNIASVMNVLSYKQIKRYKPKLPDEVDLYNFFEKYDGYARMSNPLSYTFENHDLRNYLYYRGSFAEKEYYIGDNRYYLIKFKDRGTFLVSERRYKELKSKKGE